MIELNLGSESCSDPSHRIIKAVATIGMRLKGAFICLFELPALGGKMSMFERSESDILVRRAARSVKPIKGRTLRTLAFYHQIPHLNFVGDW